MGLFLLACGALLGLAAVLNFRDRRMLLLTLVVGAGFYLPAPMESAERFYSFCFAVEVMVAILAYRTEHDHAGFVIALAILMAISHVMGYVLDGSLPFSPYPVIIKALEFFQILSCVALSPAFTPMLRNRDVST